MKKAHEAAWDRCKIQLMMKGSVFITTVAFSLRVHWTRTHTSTACTDGKNLWLNTDWIMNLTEGQRVGLYAHEIWHVCFRHMERQPHLDGEVWNDAGDHLINLMLLKEGYELPPNGLWESRFKDMSTLEIYDILIKEKKGSGGQCAGNGNPWGNDVVPADPDDIEAKNDLTNVINRAMVQSEMSNDNPGTVPGEIARDMFDLLNPKIPWQTVLNRFLTSKSKDNYSWQRPNRRFMPEHYLPSQYSESLAQISVAIDVSGSVSKEDFTRFLSEIAFIQKTMNPELMTVFNFDTQLGDVHQVSSFNPVEELPFSGGGGTAIEPVLDWAIENEPTVLIIFTDGYFHKYVPDVTCPILWIIYDNDSFDYPFGEIVYYDD